ncbi:nuclear factor erythroid 2-related factor 2 [Plakobranchus ocellatus]|uniref:Nuclear factor erythroid 2-related factor 2 n=1 Tax=Plakobranchus ocellatus TaxID=259542 RepID=A0AAV4D4H9_9GAST|nr:nuclear factor erythroid 2-related factor 2 [Plakobranchus ocellatus]
MIKEYFTDGLIGLAILLSLFRIDLDLVNINNLINYPEVQDIIQGQTAAYLPANFHHLPNTPHAFGNPKHADIDNEAFTAWFNNHYNSNFLFRRGSQNEIETFLVSGSDPSIASLQIQEIPSSSNTVSDESSGSTLLSSPTLPEEGANSYPELSVVNGNDSTNQEDAINSTSEQATVENVSLIFNNPFPGCNLTLEDLKLIDVLWKQDEDLGVGKEVFDANLRLELEKKQEMERIKIQEMKKAQMLAKEKQERERQEQANRWLRENFKRDGETGEWVSLQNSPSGSAAFSSVPAQPCAENEDFPTLDSALEYILNMDSSALQQNTDASELNQEPFFQTNYMPPSTSGLQTEEFHQPIQQQFVDQQPQQTLPAAAIEHQDSLEDSWDTLVNYLNSTTNNADANSDSVVNGGWVDIVDSNQDFFLLDDTNSGKQLDTGYVPANNTGPNLEPVSPVLEQQQANFLLNNVSLPSEAMNTSSDLVPLTSPSEIVGESSVSGLATLPELSSPVDFNLSDLGFFENITNLEGPMDEDIDMAEIDDMFRTIQSSGSSLLEPAMELSQNMDALQRLGDELNQSGASVGSSSPHEDFETIEGLEGATGGSDDFMFGGMRDLTSLKAPRRERPRIQHLSESSNDSGFAYKNGFSSSNSSAGSSYAGSPAGSSHGAEGGHTNLNHKVIGGGVRSSHNRSTSGNGTEHDPHGSHTLAQHQVAHNHTYNTPPGQVPREVKKYAQKEPSRKGPQSRDHRKALELKVPFSVEEIIESPVETFNEMISSHKLSEAQLNLIRDIRRRGKNKVAAQNCRKRKVNVIVNLSDERSELEKTRDRLLAERAHMEQETRRMRAKFGHLYAHIFQSLRDEQGQPYDPSLYSLQQSSDGNVFLVPRNISSVASSAEPSQSAVGLVSAGNGSTGPSSAASSASSSPSTTSSTSTSKADLSGPKKRKSYPQ